MSESNRNILVAYRMEQAWNALEEARLLQEAGKTTLGVVNRAYYAMFYALLALLQHSGHTPRKHIGAIALFDSEFVKQGLFDKRFSKQLHQAFNLRQVSDYHLVEPIDGAQAEELIDNAAAFIQAINNVL